MIQPLHFEVHISVIADNQVTLSGVETIQLPERFIGPKASIITGNEPDIIVTVRCETYKDASYIVASLPRRLVGLKVTRVKIEAILVDVRI